MMKKITTLILGFGLLTSSIFGQAKFYTNGGKTLVTELKTGMSDVKAVLPIPEEYANHDLIEVAIDFFAGDDSKPAGFKSNKEYKIEYLNGKKEISIWVKSVGSKSGDFCYKSDCFQMDAPAEWKNRSYTDGTISIRFFGKDINGYEWVNNQRVPTYKYSKPLSKHDIKMTYGPVIKTNQTENGMFKGHKYFGKETISEMSVEQGNEEMASIFSSKREKNHNKYLEFVNPVYFHIKDVTGVGVNDMKISIDYIKTGVILTLLHEANPGSNDYIKGIKGSYYSRYTNDVIYMPMVMETEKTDGEIAKEKDAEKTQDLRSMFGQPYKPGAALPKSNRTSAKNDKGKAYETHVQAEGAKLNWVAGKVGGIDVQMLKLNVYSQSQLENPNGYYILKAGEENNSKFIWYYVGEKNGKIFAGSVFRFEPQANTAEENEFIEKMITTYEIK